MLGNKEEHVALQRLAAYIKVTNSAAKYCDVCCINILLQYNLLCSESDKSFCIETLHYNNFYDQINLNCTFCTAKS